VKRDDCTLTPDGLKKVQKQADLLLRKASAYGRFPTPVTDIIAAAKLEIARENCLDKVFLGSLYRRLPNSVKLLPDRVKHAAGKVLGLLDRADRTIHLDPELHPKRTLFLSLHETGHDVLPWQRQTFELLEDSDSEIDAYTNDLFEREANCFASEVLFQLNTFADEALSVSFGIKAPLDLSKRYGAGFYATARRYVGCCTRACSLLVFDRKTPADPLMLRRSIPNPLFRARFGELDWPNTCGPGDFFFENRPRNKFTPPRSFSLSDVNGDSVACLLEAFDSTRQVFFLIYPL
jgi:hypothetical protein